MKIQAIVQALLVGWELTFLWCFLPAPIAAATAPKSFHTLTTLDADLANFRLGKLRDELAKMPAGAERDYLAGLLANRCGQVSQSIEFLQRALPSLRQAKDARASIALKTLADDYTKNLNYGAAAKMYDDLFDLFPGENKGGTRDDAGVLHLLSGVQPMTIDWHGPTRLKTARNAIGSRVIELDVNGVKEQWLLDTGANYSCVSRSFAQRLGLKILPGFAQTGSGLTGLENRLQAAVIPTMQVGGATLKNVIVLIFDDANLNIHIGDRSYQINAILGYPAFQAMRVITFRRDGEFEAGPSTYQNGTEIPMYMRRLTPVVNLRANGVTLPFTLDTGASGTELSIRYYERFRHSNLSWKPGEEETSGAGGNIRRTIYTQPVLRLGIGSKTAILKDVSVTPKKTNSGLDELYGNIGQDMFANFESFTLDFADMRFKIGAPVLPKTPR
ncbi:MAG TPA: aspartyl protease family protein [Edaphobacter sp.]|nr:aspartyl protease family protein [Edaphobacter sp.]